MRIALTGNPNSGKTTMFNALTGSNEKVGNWAGVTVDKKEHAIKKAYYSGEEKLIAVDLPGAYSMSPFTSEESITSAYVKNENPDVIINIVDATNLSRSLFFTTQLLELGIPVVVALNKSDINEKKKTIIDAETLSQKLGCSVVETVSTSADGLKAVIETAVSQVGKEQSAPYVQDAVDLTDKKAVVAADRKRFEFVNRIVKEVETRKVLTKDKNFGDKIDAVLTNKWLGIPIFAVVMLLVFQISQSWVGPLIADGYERLDTVSVVYNETEMEFAKEDNLETDADDEGIIGTWVCEETENTIEFAEDGTVVFTEGKNTINGEYTFDEEEEKLDITLEDENMESSFESGFTIPGLVTLIEMFKDWVGGYITNPLLNALVAEGVIGGVGAVVGFLPLVMVMYFLIALLEDCGYMSRVAVVLDPIFKRVGLSGKSVIPFVIGIGCAVPGVMASRTIRNERERRATAMLTPFMPCGAKIPVISLFAGAFFDNAGWVSAICYLSGIVLIFLGALLVNLITGHKARKSFFIIELPEYKAPSLWGAFKSMCSRGWSYVVKAATIILLCNTAVHIMQTFTWKFTEANATASNSILESIASPFAYLLVPIVGVLSWQLAAAAVTGFIAKENVVGTLAVCFAATKFINPDELVINDGYASEVAGVMTGLDTSGQVVAITAVAALAYLMFNLFSPPCFAAIGAMNSEMKSAKWLWGGIGLQLGVGYTVAYFIYTIGTLITAPTTLNVVAAIAGLVAVLCMVGIVIVLIINTNRKLKAEYALKSAAKEKVAK